MKKLIALIFLMAVYLMIFTATFSLASEAGESAFDSLRVDLGARASAMGGALLAVPGDGDAVQYNPATLSTLKERQVTLMHNEYVEDVSQQYLSLGLKKGWGFWINHLDLGSFDQTTLADPTGSNLSELDAANNAFGLGYAREMRAGFSIGASVKYIEEKLGDVKGNAAALDIGALASLQNVQGLRLAAAVQNLGSSPEFESKKEKLPLLFRSGASYEQELFKQNFLFAADVTHQRGEGFDVSLGCELMIKNFDLRVGYKSRNATDIGLTTGASFQLLKKYYLDYAFVPFGDLGDSHRISMSVKF